MGKDYIAMFLQTDANLTELEQCTDSPEALRIWSAPPGGDTKAVVVDFLCKKHRE